MGDIDIDQQPRVADSVIAGLGLGARVWFAPVRRLDDGVLAAVEVQVGGDTENLAHPGELRRAARLMGQTTALDTFKRGVAAGGAAVTSIADVLPVLVTTDLDIDAIDDNDLAPLFRLVVSVSPADLAAHPHRTLAAVAAARRQGRSICVDGFGVADDAITQLGLIEPDIIITAPALLTQTTDQDMAAVGHALIAHTQRSHAVIVAEGVDTPALRDAAITLGATYGTGALYPSVDDPAGLAAEHIEALPDSPVWTTPESTLDTPYAIARHTATPRRGTKHLLIEMSKSLEAQAAAAGKSMVVVGTFQHARHFTTATSKRWTDLADATGYAGVYGVGLSTMIDGNIHHAPLDPNDDLVNEWTVAILGPHFAALIAARDNHDNGPDLDRTFDFVQSFDRLTTTQAITSILRRFTT